MVNFRLCFYDDYACLITEPKMTAKHYMSKPIGFAMDLIAALPVEIFALCAVPSGTSSTLWCWV